MTSAAPTGIVKMAPGNNAFKKDKDYHASADLTGQANHLGVTFQADIIEQKLPENNGG
jgi:fructose-bisphosphate aldolase, class I